MEQVGKYSLLFNFTKEFIENCYCFFLKCLVEITSRDTWPWIFFVGRSLTKNSVSFIDIRLLRLSLSFCVHLGGLYFARNLSLSSKLLIYWHKVAHHSFLFFYYL